MTRYLLNDPVICLMIMDMKKRQLLKEVQDE